MRFLLLALTTVFLAGCSQLPPSSTNTDTTLPPVEKNDALTAEDVEVKTLSDSTEQWILEVQYPQITAPGFDTLNAKLKEEGEDTLRQLKETAEVISQQLATESADIDTSSFPWRLETTFETEYVSQDIVSFVMILNEYTGGAHGNQVSASFNYDVAGNKVLGWEDLFIPDSNYLALVADYVKNQIQWQGINDDTNWISDGASATPMNYKTFSITPKGILVTFDPYQVAAYAFGMPQVLVPYSVVESAIPEDSLLRQFEPYAAEEEPIIPEGEVPPVEEPETALIQDCPSEKIVNKMPGTVEDSENSPAREYYIYEGVRREVNEFDPTYVEQNCEVTVTEVF